MRQRLLATVASVLLFVGAVASPAFAAGPDDPPVVPGLVTIDGGLATASPEVTLRLVPPTGSDGTVRISNDGATWVELPWSAVVPWSLVDGAGGNDLDGSRTVTVDYGDGSAWHQRGTATIELDRVAPHIDDLAVSIDGQVWRGTAVVGGREAGSEVRWSLDGTTWSAWSVDGIVDIWAAPGGGTWALGDKTLWAQTRDAAGNESNVVSGTAVVTDIEFQPDDYGGPVPMSFELPEPAITGHPFTIRPIYPPGYVKPADLYCEWTLHWGDDASILDIPNPSWGELIVERPKSSGACTEFTFTIPYNSARQFSWMFQMGRKPASHGWEEWTGLYTSPNGQSSIFRAATDGTDPRFLASNVPFAYVLPETTLSQAGDTVTYRLHTVGTSTVPQTGMFWAYPLNCYINPQWSQQGGTTWTYRPSCDGPWVTGWTGTMGGGYMRSQYDPLVDGRAPWVGAPSVVLRTGGFGTSAAATVRWAATDKGSGVYQYQLQVSRNGGSWSSVALPSRLTTSVPRTLATTGTYRFRVRARDRVGNWSTWVNGPVLRAAVLQETTSAATWSTGWSPVSGSAFTGGGARAATAAGATVRLTTAARSLAWVTRRGPGRGLAQVYVDGVLAATIDLRAPSLSPRAVLFVKSWPVVGTHTLLVRLLGTSGSPLVETDAFLRLQ